MNVPFVYPFRGALSFAMLASYPLCAQAVGSLAAEPAYVSFASDGLSLHPILRK